MPCQQPKPSALPDEWCDSFTNKIQNLACGALACGAEIYYIDIGPIFFLRSFPSIVVGSSGAENLGNDATHRDLSFGEVSAPDDITIQSYDRLKLTKIFN